MQCADDSNGARSCIDSLEKAVYCENCTMISSSARRRCGLCGSEQIVRLAHLIPKPCDPGPDPALSLAA